ncbi:sugar ABC transporter ATP-binding protein [Geodermatophilus sabuli]|uniref:Monosaccharide ABC transporter ATP-binding protein, CUT2 family n=1 Tax=Geodermatophilus sabuli TaxID=1564158 RepID=A0A285EF68_9ACTN|nr:sugar ABC transporter ATP-binding protein [Geodermatophilus sabuli]MBB3083563.1 ABC-type sugar transport system ATPase subunit [Geodermatophilus sabuli]SNX96716.1 monosaccharide ABC transporter ATP-binding protein, CUT2 family [Geodermatophilus sabuli]
MTSSTAAVLQARGLTKSFPGVRALDRADLTCRSGRVHALVGENGAGKSTLVRILTGNQLPDEGEVLLDGRSVRFADPREAMAEGVSAVYQELTVLPAMSVGDNVMLGQERTSRGLIDRAAQDREVRAALARVGLGDLDPRTRAEDLSLANQQMVEIARALVRRSRVIVLDEPSAVLSGDKLESLFTVVRGLAADGVAIVYISHLLEEVTDLADDVTVLRDGRVVSTGPAGDYDVPRIIRDMVGRDVDAVFPPLPEPADEVVLAVRGLVPVSSTRSPVALDLDVRAGEIVGVAGMVGSGRSRLLRTIAGEHPRAAGTVEVAGRPVPTGTRRAIAAGVALVPEERKTEGLVLPLSVRANTTLAALGQVLRGGFLSTRRERVVFQEEQARLGIKASDPEQGTWQLSGGNQQKIVLAKWLRRGPRVLLLDEPTRGVDVGAKSEIYRLVTGLAVEGMAVVMVSSDLPEVLGLSHRVLVCRGGGVVGELAGDDINEENVMHVALDTAGTSR